MVLPSEYKQVKYIQSTATNQGTKTSSGQVIDTLFTPTPNTKISIDLAFTNTTTQGRLFGVQTEESGYCTFCSYINGSSQRARAFKDGVGNWISSGKSVDTARHTFELDKEGYRIYTNGTQIYNADNQATPTKSGHHTLPLFCTWENTGDSGQTYNRYLQHGSYKLYGCKIRDNNTLARDFVPVIRVSDDKPGLYDLVNDVFYTNVGTGEFTYEKYAEKGKFSKILLGESQIYPPVPEWTLWDETNMANSTTGSSGVIASTNGKFIRPSYSFGGGNGNYYKQTRDGYDVLTCSSTHGNLHIGFSDSNYNELMGHAKVKIVFDYFNLGANQSNYTNGIYFGQNEYLNDTASSSTIGVGNKWPGMSFSYNTGYSMEQILTPTDMSCTATITNLTTQASQTFTYTKVFQRETNSSYIINGGGNKVIQLTNDYQGGPVSTGNIHIYISN